MLRLALVLLVAVVNAKELSVVDWQQIRAEYERQRHRVFPAKSGWSALHAGQQWVTKFDGRGFTISPHEGAWQFGLELDTALRGAPVTVQANRLSYHWSAELEEWFINDPRGLEHGFTLGAPREIVLKVRGGLRGRGVGEALEFVDASGLARVRYSELRAWDARRKPVAAVMRAFGDRVKITVEDRGAVYPVTIDPIVQQAYVKASNTGANDLFGSSVAVSGDTVAIGAPGEASNATGVNGNQADNSAGGSGAVYIFVRSGGVWSQQAYVKASNTDAGDNFGRAIALSADTLVVGAAAETSSSPGVNGNQSDNSSIAAGAAYVFVRSGGTWTQQAYLKASNTNAFDSFGGAVAVAGDTIVIGARNQNTTGAAYVFVRSGAAWSEQAILKASNAGGNDYFGWSVSISGDTVLVTAYWEDSSSILVNGAQDNNSAVESGAAYVFVRNGTVWSQQAYLKASNTEAQDQFGMSGSISGDTIAIGAHYESSSGNQGDNSVGLSGAVYIYQRTGTTWAYQAYIKAPTSQLNEQFGDQVALSGDKLVVGARYQGTGTQLESGAAYVFGRVDSNWLHETTLKASNAKTLYQFGASVAIGGEFVAVGAPIEASNGTGVNSNQNDTSLSNAGAAYVFSGLTINNVIGSNPYGAAFTSSGTGCQAGNYNMFKTLAWTPGADCTLSVTSPQTILGAPHYFRRWEDNSTSATRTVRAGTSQKTYQASFLLSTQPSATPVPAGVYQANPRGTSQTLYVSAEDADGSADIARISFRIANSSNDSVNVCSGFFDTETQSYYLYDDAGTTLLGPFITNVTASISNSQCAVASSGSLYLSRTVTGLTFSLGINLWSPFNAASKIIYLRVRDFQGQEGPWTQSGIWEQTPGARAILVTPAPGTVLTASSATFTWTDAASGGPYWLDIGNAVGKGDISAGSTSVTNRSVSGLPTDGRTIYVRLWTFANGAWLTPIDYTVTACNGCAGSGAQLLTHTPGVSVLAGSVDTFVWSAAAGATKYWLDVGTSAGSGNIHAGETPLVLKEISNLPVDGRKVYIRIWSYINNTWTAPSDYAIDSCSGCTARRASLRAPLQGSTLNSTSVTFSWSVPANVTHSQVTVGYDRGTGQLFNGTVTGKSVRVDNIPADGRQIYVMVSPFPIGNLADPSFYSFTACTGCTDNGMHLQTPVAGSKLTSTSTTFTWSPAASATKYWLEVGNSLGVGDISGGETTATSRTVSNLPTDGRTLFVRLYPFVNGAWGPPKDYVYEACTGCTSVATAALTAPAQGSTLASASVNFTWGAVPGATNYWLDVGNSKGVGDISAGATTATSKQVGNLPIDGRTIHARLWTFLNGAWQAPNDYTFTACTACFETRAMISRPVNGTAFTTRTATFEWTAGDQATQYWLDVGTVPGQGNIFGGAMTARARQVTNLPANGAPIYVALWTFRNGAWQTAINYTFTACNGCAAENRALLTAPAIGSTLATGTVNFSWSAGTGATAYWLDVGNSVGDGSIAARNVATTSTTVTVPRDGRTLYLRLWTFVNGAWQPPFDYRVTACTGC